MPNDSGYAALFLTWSKRLLDPPAQIFRAKKFFAAS